MGQRNLVQVDEFEWNRASLETHESVQVLRCSGVQVCARVIEARRGSVSSGDKDEE